VTAVLPAVESVVPLQELFSEVFVAMFSTHAALFDKYVTMMGRPPPTVTPELMVEHWLSAYVPRMMPEPKLLSMVSWSLEKSSK
jgi:hypothetical protein